MKVAHVLFARRDPVRPVLGFVWDAIQAMADAGLEVEPIILTPSGSPERREVLLDLRPTPTLVRTVRWPRRSIESGTLALTASLMARRPAERPSVLEGSFLDEGGFAAAFAGEVLGVPSIAVAHGSDVRAALGELDDGGALARGRRQRAQATLRRASQVIAVSHFLARGIETLASEGALGPALASGAGAEVQVMRWSTRADRFPLHPRPPERRAILFVGLVGRAKGVDLLLRAFAALPTNDLVLRIVGPDAGDLDVAAEARALGLADRVERLGALPEEALAEVYANASMTVLPSRQEGFGVVLVESLLVGRPIVGADVGGIPEIASESVGALFPAEDVGALTRAMAGVLERTAGGAFAPKDLRAKALPFTWDVNGPRLAEIARALRPRGTRLG